MTDQYGERGPWHSGDEKPEIDGVYERKICDILSFSKFQNGKWYRLRLSVDSAYNEKALSTFTKHKWRGLAKKP